MTLKRAFIRTETEEETCVLPQPWREAKWSRKLSSRGGAETRLPQLHQPEAWVSCLSSGLPSAECSSWRIEFLISAWSFRRSAERNKWKEGHGIILETKSFPRYVVSYMYFHFHQGKVLSGRDHSNRLPLLLVLGSQLQAHHESLPAHTQNSFVHEEPLRLEDPIW